MVEKLNLLRKIVAHLKGREDKDHPWQAGHDITPKISSGLLALCREEPGHWHDGETVFGDFIVEREVGRGGCGVVYLLRQETLGNLFALKRIRSKDPTLHRLLLSELRTWTSLSTPAQPHICACRFFRTIEAETVIFHLRRIC